jgi:hypothetical protein
MTFRIALSILKERKKEEDPQICGYITIPRKSQIFVNLILEIHLMNIYH